MALSFLTVLTNPNAFFSQDPAAWERLRTPALLVLAAALIAGATAYLTTDLIAGMMPAEVQQYRGVMVIAGSIGGPITTFVLWAVWTGVFFLVSLIFQGKGSFRRTLAAIGYGYLPLVLGGAVSLVLFMVTLPGIRVTPVTSLEEIPTAAAALMHQPVMLLSGILGILFLLWAANIWVFGIRHARGLPLRNAAITVGVPVALYLLYTIVNLGVLA